MNKKLVIIAGPTGVGKTSSSIAFAKEIGGEIISADSMQVYRGMDIGSGKIKKEEMQGVPHHLLDVLSPLEKFDVTVFQKLCKEAMDDIYSRGKIPILVGGTGFYLQSVLYDIDFSEGADNPAYRKMLEDKTTDELWEMLKKCDEESTESIPKENRKRVIRALEYFNETGEKISVHNERERKKESPYDFLYFVLYRERSEMYERINLRVDQMVRDGLFEEVKRLMDSGVTREMTSMQGLGYKQILDYYEGLGNYEDTIERIKQETRHFAKRQLTWFRREKDAIWVNLDERNLIDVYKDGNFR